MVTQLLDKLDKESVLKDFDNLINVWCKEYSSLHGIQKENMCMIAIEYFGDAICSTKIRSVIDSEFKQQFRIDNAKQKQPNKEEKISKLRKLADHLGLSGQEIIDAFAGPIYQSGEMLSSKEKQK